MVNPIALLALLEQQALAGLPANAAIGSHAEAHGLLDGRPLAVTARVGVLGETAVTYRYGGARMQRISLLRLICPERSCTEAELAKDRWNEFVSRRGGPSPAKKATAPEDAGIHSLVTVQHGDRLYEARPAQFACLTECPVDAHLPRVMHKRGWDLYDEGRCIAGGTVNEGAFARPRLPDIESANRWLVARMGE